MNKQGVFRCPQSIGLALALIVTVLMASGCSSVGQTAIGECEAAAQIRAADAIPILVTLTAKGGETLAATRERVLARLREAMPAGTLRAARTYQELPLIALSATPGILALLLTLPDVRSIEVDRSLNVSATVYMHQRQGAAKGPPAIISWTTWVSHVGCSPSAAGGLADAGRPRGPLQ